MNNIIINKLLEIKEGLYIPQNPSEKLDKVLFNASIDRLLGLTNKYWDNNSNYSKRLKQLKKDVFENLYSSDIKKLRTLIDIIIDDIELDVKKNENISKPLEEETRINEFNNQLKILNNNIFIVHGHNEIMKQSVARIIEKLKLNPIILHERSNEGNTIIEKFMKNSNVGFAIVLLSADDIGYSKKDGSKNAKSRARQNVIFELGFFVGKLGRNKVIALVENDNNFEIPSDLSGVIYLPFDKNEKWKFDIAKELMNNGYHINVNNIM